MYTQKVREFTSAAAEQELPKQPVLMEKKEIDFIRSMVNDELDELAEAANTVEQADALVDAIYYICDTAVRHGFNLDPLFEIVHQANMQKVVNGKVLRREDGKIMKPDTWKDPEPLLIAEMERQKKNGSFENC